MLKLKLTVASLILLGALVGCCGKHKRQAAHYKSLYREDGRAYIRGYLDALSGRAMDPNGRIPQN